MGEQSAGGVTNDMNAIVRSRVQPDENGIIRPFVDVVIGEDVLTLEPGAANEIGARLIDSAAQTVDHSTSALDRVGSTDWRTTTVD